MLIECSLVSSKRSGSHAIVGLGLSLFMANVANAVRSEIQS